MMNSVLILSFTHTNAFPEGLLRVWHRAGSEGPENATETDMGNDYAL